MFFFLTLLVKGESLKYMMLHLSFYCKIRRFNVNSSSKKKIPLVLLDLFLLLPQHIVIITYRLFISDNGHTLWFAFFKAAIYI